MLSSLLERAPGSRGAVFCDYEGEFVELVIRDPQPPGCGPLSDFEMRVFGAQMAAALLTLQNNSSQRGAGGMVEMRLGCAGGTLLCRALRDGYYLVLLLARGTPSAPAAFELRKSAVELTAALAAALNLD
jgi:hypothetical protein